MMNRIAWLAAGVGLLLLLAGASGLAWLYHPQIASAQTAQPAPTATATPEPRPVTGVRQTFLMVPGDSSLSYVVNQTLLGQDSRVITVTGKTNQVDGYLTLDYDNPAASQFGEFLANLRLLYSGDLERDEALRGDWLETARFPWARFVVKEVREFPDRARPGEPVQFQLAGDLTLKQVTRLILWDVTAKLNVDRLTGQATTVLMLSDFDVALPEVPGVLKVSDGVTVTLDFAFETAKPKPLPVGT